MTHQASLHDSYALCRNIAKREAKNFYYAFLALSLPRRNAICAVYAFMRQADDLADDESLSRIERRCRLNAWLDDWRGICHGGDSSNPVFVSVRDAVERYSIPLNLLDELVAGVTMDLEVPVDIPNTYSTFGDLYRYCYLVASVVGLVCIRIFGYTDPRAEKFAEETGIALQLTNILRDVKEDIERGRVYLPLDLLDEFGETPGELRELASTTRTMTERERAMLATLAIRAEKYYVSGKKLIPLLDRDSRAAMWVLLTIYHRLLGRIAARRMEVFRERIALSTAEKFSVLARGAVMAAWNRVAP